MCCVSLSFLFVFRCNSIMGAYSRMATMAMGHGHTFYFSLCHIQIQSLFSRDSNLTATNYSVYRTMDECVSEEVCDMGSYRTRRQPSVIRAHITHFFTYHTSPRVVYSLYHNNCPMHLLFVEVLPNKLIQKQKYFIIFS